MKRILPSARQVHAPLELNVKLSCRMSRLVPIAGSLIVQENFQSAAAYHLPLCAPPVPASGGPCSIFSACESALMTA